MQTDVLLVLTNCPNVDVADRIALALVDERLAACVNRLATARSIYRWQGAVEMADEVPLLIKCTRDRYNEVEARIRQLHPYTVPEVLALPIERGFPPYLRWVADESTPPQLA